MILSGIVSFLVGSAMGARLRVWVLVPAIMGALMLSVISAWSTEIDVFWIVVNWLASTVCLQVGYLAGVVRFGSASRPRPGQSDVHVNQLP